MKPLLPNKNASCCDDCAGVKLVVRDDDKESVIRERLQLYKDKTQPILDYYIKNAREETRVIDFEAKKGVGDYPAIKTLLKDALKI